MKLKEKAETFLILAPLLVLLFIVSASLLAPILEYQRLEISSFFYKSVSKLCHHIPTHCIFIETSNMAICARCFSIYFSLLAFGTFFFYHRTQRINWKISLLLTLPCWVDGLTQYFGWRESNNSLRIVTGLLAGSGLGLIVFPLQYRCLAFFKRRQWL